MSAHVYRVFDSAGRLLYIGSTVSPQNRFQCHRTSQAAWLPYAASVAWDTYEDEDQARAEEKLAIMGERPRFNKHWNEPFSNAARAPFPDAEVLDTPILDLLRGAPGRVETVHDRKRAALYLINGEVAS